MPKYIYRCPECDSPDLEIDHPITGEWEFQCDPCGATMRRVPQAIGLAFKGDGWAGKTGETDAG